MRKNSLMVAAAAAALTIGSGIAMAQSPGAPAPSGAPAKSGAPAASGSMNSSGSASMPGSGATTGAGVSSEQKGSGATAGAGASTEPRNVQDGKGPAQKGAAQDKPDAKRKGAQHDKAGSSKERMGQSDKSRAGSETTGQAPSGSSGNASKDRDQMKSGGSRESGQTKEMNRSGQDGTRTDSRSSASTTTNVNLTTEQRTRIKQVIVKQNNAPRVSNVDFSLTIGTAVPRNKVRLVALPPTIIEIHPAWRGYEYFMVGDRLVIVNPRSLQIVAIIEV